jgi:tripartite ATP-independent transporter DctM subunit
MLEQLGPEIITPILFAGLVIGLVLGLPLAFVMGGFAMIVTFFVMGPNGFQIVVSSNAAVMGNLVLIAVPLFIFMANILETSGVADDLYTMMHRWMGPLRGGLAMGTIIICTLMAAMTGISAAATVTMGVIALPAMLKRGYQKEIALGSVSAGGALGQLIPPSIIMILYAVMAQVSVGKMFIGGIFPGLVLSGLFLLYISIRSLIQKDIAPALPPEERASWRLKLISLRAVLLPVLLVIMVLGSIFGGLATPTEAAAVGATGAIMCAAIYRRLTWGGIKEAAYRTLRLTAMCMWITVGAKCFTSIYTAMGGLELIKMTMTNLPMGPWGILILIQFIYLLLGCFLDPIGIIMITVPVFVPIMQTLGFDVIWFGVLFVVNMEMGFLTPPFGFNLFYMKAIAPEGVTMGDIYRSIYPFVMLQLVGLILCMVFPQLILWLPGKMIGN